MIGIPDWQFVREYLLERGVYPPDWVEDIARQIREQEMAIQQTELPLDEDR